MNIPKLLRESLNSILENNEQVLNQILAKINQSGVESLTNYEKNTLDRLSDNKIVSDSNVDAAFNWLVEKYGNLKTENDSFLKFGKIKSDRILFLDDNYETIMQIEGNVLYVEDTIFNVLRNDFNISDEDISDNLIKNLMLKKYKIQDNGYKISLIFLGT